MTARLISLGDRPGIPLAEVLTVVGRHHGCDARVDSVRVSRRHCCLALDGAKAVVRDLDSANGTRINGRRVQDGCLRPGDELAIAHLRYRLAILGGGAEAPATAAFPAGALPETIPDGPPSPSAGAGGAGE